MRIRHVSTQVRDLASATRFYGDVLQLPLRRGSEEIVVPVGESALTLREEPGSAVCDHLAFDIPPGQLEDRKSTRLNSSHVAISYAVFCLKKKIKYTLVH